jgi:hypothetical protein
MRVSSYDHNAPTPPVGSYWRWNKGNGDRTKVVEVKWNGEEWWVRTVLYDPPGADPRWNDLTVFWEQVRPWSPPNPKST